jgi:putative hydrolase of HD superfamily
VKDLDRFEMAAQGKRDPLVQSVLDTQTKSKAVEYEQRHNRSLQPFLDSSIPNIKHTEVKEWGATLVQGRTKNQGSLT